MPFICLYFGLFTLCWKCWKCWKDLFWVLLQVTGSHSDHSAWYHSADGYAHGSWGIKLLIQVFFWQYNPQGSFIPFSNCKLHVCFSFWSYLHYCLALTYNIFGGWDFLRVTSKCFDCLCSLLFVVLTLLSFMYDCGLPCRSYEMRHYFFLHTWLVKLRWVFSSCNNNNNFFSYFSKNLWLWLLFSFYDPDLQSALRASPM